VLATGAIPVPQAKEPAMTTTTTTQAINGVDVTRLTATVGAISEMPSLAKFQFRAANRWMDGGHNQSTIKSFYGAGQEDASRTTTFVLDNDEPDVLLGRDIGANPVEYVLHALAGCITTTLVYHAAARGIRITEVQSTLEGDMDMRGILNLGGARNGFEQVRVTLTVKGDAPDQELRDLVVFAQQHSPVFDIVTNRVPVEVKMT
jgi:uncharacterized OsmC-like protein